MAKQMAKAVLEAMRQGGIKNLTYIEQCLVAKAMQIIKALPNSFDEVHIEAKVKGDKDD